MTATTTAAGGVTSKVTMDPADFATIARFVLDRSGIVLSEGQEYLVESRLAPLARHQQLDGVAGVAAALRSRPPAALQAAIVDAMTTNETSFFRDRHPFDAMADKVIPELLTARRRDDDITIWCAAASSGQEPYTLAMILHERFPALLASGRVQILATDLSPTMIARMAEGRYSQFEINRGLPAPLLVTYFEQVGRDWVIRQDLRNMVEARELNLLASWSGVPRCDIVLIRNVLIYFSVEVKQQLLRRIRDEVLRPDGYLFLGSSETTLNIDAGYVAERHGRATYYRPDLRGTP